MSQRIWAPVDVTRLLDQIKKNKPLEEISRRERRPISSIQAKLKEIAVDLYFNKNIDYDKVKEITGIPKEILIVKRKPIPERSGSPKDIEDAIILTRVPKIELVPETIKANPGYHIRLSRENPFSISSLSELINTTIDICLSSRYC